MKNLESNNTTVNELLSLCLNQLVSLSNMHLILIIGDAGSPENEQQLSSISPLANQYLGNQFMFS